MSKEADKSLFGQVKSQEDTPDKPTYVTIGFENGIPVSLNGKRTDLLNLIARLNSVAASNGVGATDTIEDGVVGLKTRAIYEWPAAFCIIEAHKELERLTSTIHQNNFKPIIDKEWAYIVYAGLWFDPLFDSLNSFIDQVNIRVNGTIKLKLYKGKLTIVGRKSKYSLYKPEMAIYKMGYGNNDYTGMLDGFIKIHNLHTSTAFVVWSNAKKANKNGN